MPTIDVSQTNVKKEGIALNIESIKDPKSSTDITFDPNSIQKESPEVSQSAVNEVKQSPIITLDIVRELKD